MFKLKNKIIIILYIVWLVTCTMSISVLAESEIPKGSEAFGSSIVSIDVEYGYDDTAKGGRYLPVHIDYTNNETNEFSGKVSIYSQESDGEIYQYKYDVSLNADEKKGLDYYIPIGYGADHIIIELSDLSGKTILSKRVKLNINKTSAELFVGLLSDTPDKLEYLNNNEIDYGLLSTRTFILDATSFPKVTQGLEQLDVIVISNYRIRNLSEIQTRALMDWVSEGGVLILGTGQRVDDTLGRFAPELLDDMYEEPELTNIDMGVNIINDMPEKPRANKTIMLPCVDVSLHGGNVIIPSGNIAAVTAVNKENGTIAVAAYDFADISDFVVSNNSYTDSTLTKIIGTEKLDSIAAETYGNDNGRYWSIQALINIGEVDKLPPINLYIFEIIAYILLVGPGLYIFFKQRGMTRYYRRGVIILSFCFTAIIYFMGAKTRFKDTFYNYVTIMDADEDKLSNLSYINIMNPYNKSYEAKIDNSYTVLPITKYTAVTDDIAADDSTIKINYNDDATNLTVGNVGAFNPRFFMLSGKTDNVDKLGFTGDVHLFDNTVSGYIVNNYPYDVTDAVVMFYGKMLYIGDIKKGETKNLDSLEIINIPLTDTYIVSGKITGLNDYIKADITDTKYLKSLEKSNIIAFYLDYYMAGYTADARVIAFSDESPDNTLIVGDNLDAYGMTMLTSALSVDSKEDNLIYRSVLMKNPTVLSGEYNVKTNSMYGSEPVVLEYSIGNDIDISKLIFEPISEYFLTDYSNKKINYFSGTLALYNYTTGKYDYIKNDKNEYDSYELKQYLSPVNTITVRYIYDNSKDTQMDIILPMLDVVGSER